MGFQIKKGGVYAAPVAVSVKKSGVYSAVAGIFTKVAGAYQNVMATLFASIMAEGDNYMTRASQLTGVANNSSGSVSFWFAPNFVDTTYHNVFVLSNSYAWIDVTNASKLRVVLFDGAKYFIFTTTSTLAKGVESHYAISWNTNFGVGLKQAQLYRDGVLDMAVTQDTDIAFTPVLIGLPAIGASIVGASPISGTLREIMYWPSVKIDWSANLSKVYSAGNPVDVGATGSLVTGTAPKVYLSLQGMAAASNILTNKGTGGDFVLASGTPAIRADTALIGYGDSLVYGTGSTVYPKDTWMFKVSRSLNLVRRRINCGVGSLSMDQIIDTMTNPVGPYTIETVTQAAAKYRDKIWILEGGYNSIGNGSALIIARATTMVETLLAADPSAKWIFLGIPNGNINSDGISGGARYTTIIAANAGIAALCGSNYLDIRQWLIDNGLAAVAGAPHNITPNANDATDIANGVVPRQLRSLDDSVHWSDAGQTAVAAAVKAKLQALGYD